MNPADISDTPKLEARHAPSGLNSRFNGWQPAFEDYIASQCEMIAHARSAAGADCSEAVVEGNAPFEMKPQGNYARGKEKPYRRGVLLVHGLTDSPYFMRPLGEFFRDNGFRVMAVLLPGHGTQPGDLLDVSWHEWAKAVAYGVERLDAEVDELYLAGYSAGGALCVRHSLNDARVRGLFLFSPAFRISPRAARAHWHQLYSWLTPSAKWVSILPDLDTYKYESLTMNAAAQMHALTQEVGEQALLHKLNLPVFAAASADDVTANPAATLNFMMRMPHPCCKLVLYTRQPDKYTHGFPPEKLEEVSSVQPKQKILCFAHTSIVLPPEDAHYGAEGDYSSCTHYYPHNMEKYRVCLTRPREVPQGEITEQNLADWTMRRLTFNPHFDQLKDSMRRFIERLP